MVLCKKCAHMSAPYHVRCQRCGLSWPYFRSRRWRLLRRPRVGMMVGKDCRRCGEHTERLPTPAWLRPLRKATHSRCSLRSCLGCHWQGVAFHARHRRAAPRFIPVHNVTFVRRGAEVEAGAGSGA